MLLRLIYFVSVNDGAIFTSIKAQIIEHLMHLPDFDIQLLSSYHCYHPTQQKAGKSPSIIIATVARVLVWSLQ